MFSHKQYMLLYGFGEYILNEERKVAFLKEYSAY